MRGGRYLGEEEFRVAETAARDALGAIATWDLAHSEALTVERAVDIATDAIVKHSEL
jgi:hypothetical protein